MKKALLMILLVAIASVSCKKSVESEKKAWEANLKRVSQLTFEFPQFTNVLKEQTALAQKLMDEAATIADEKSKIQKMADANSMILATFVRNLEEIKSLKTKIRNKIIDVRGLKTVQQNEIMMANQAMSDGERIIYNCEMKLNTVISTRNDADAVTSLVLSDLRMAESTLDRVIAMVKDREDKEKAAQQQQIDKANADKAAKEKSESPITCKYCGAVNLPTATICKGCGASLK